MASAGGGGGESPAEYEEALDCLSSLITRRTRADGTNKGDCFDLLFEYLKILELEEPLANLKVIHVAGTKGKGSTCAFAESILRNCGFRTGLFASPHLIDVRERFRLDGEDVSKEKFLEYFWWCWRRLKEEEDDDLPMPNYFRFLTLLALKIFIAEQVDVAILEVGLGGKFDATNVVQSPIVCGISSLGFDHMEILGNTLGEIAGEKAGIFKKDVVAYTVPQPEEAMSVLRDKASHLNISLKIVQPLDVEVLKGGQLGLEGEHQYLNAGLAIALSRIWLQKTGNAEGINLDHTALLPEQFVKGLATASLQGRAQVVPDPYVFMQNRDQSLVFYLDGAHSPESLGVCARWFCQATQKDSSMHGYSSDVQRRSAKQILLFNCMSVRDPLLLLPALLNACVSNGIHFNKALFVPNESVFNKVGPKATLSSGVTDQVDLSWQLSLQKVWDNLISHEGAGNDEVSGSLEQEHTCQDDKSESSLVFPSIPLAISWLRDQAMRNPPSHFQVLVTGSLHLVGDVLRHISSSEQSPP